MTLAEIAKALGGEVCSGQVLAPGPGHSAKDRSLCVRMSADAPDGFVVTSFANDDWRVCRDHVRARLGLGAFRPGGSRATLNRDLSQIETENVTKRDTNADANAMRLAALAIWRRSVDPRGTAAERYLNGRDGITLPDCAALEAIRFHPNCSFDGGRVHSPAMICLVGNILSNAPQAIHRLPIDLDGKAAPISDTKRWALGPIGGGAIKLDPDEDVTMGLAIGEGVETCLAGRQIGFRPTWALLSAGQIKDFPVLPGIDGLTIFVEADETSREAVQVCFDRWRGAGRDVFVQASACSSDLNDALRGTAS